MAAWSLGRWLAPWLTLDDERPIAAPSLDSRGIEPGGVFLACAGSAGHGVNYLDSALAAGACAVIWEPAADVDSRQVERMCERAGARAIAWDGLSRQVGFMAARYYDNPSAQLVLIGVTGTDGKTSVTQFIARSMGGGRGSCGVIGTLGWGWPDDLAPTALTTPDAVTLQSWLASLRQCGATAVAMEVSSHALAQERVSALDFDVAVLTNLGHDHLDYHGSMAAYRAAKRRLFDLGDPVPVLNLEDPWGLLLVEELAQRSPVGYSLIRHSKTRVWCADFQAFPGGMRLEVATEQQRQGVELPLIGRFNALNVLATAGGLLAGGIEANALAQRLGAIRPVPGRMEPIRRGGGPTVIVDYAHTPGALTAAVQAVREHCMGWLWLVFGCGGERDRDKRAAMGAIASERADRVVLTNDNPRHEDPAAIVTDIRNGAGSQAIVILDRGEAIRHALSRAAASDCVLIAGKGHEDWQTIGHEQHAFSDREEAAAALEEVC